MSAVFETPQDAIQSNPEKLLHFLKFIEKDANESHELAQLGAHTQLAKAISDYITNPMVGLVNTYNSVHKNLIDTLFDVVKHFLALNKEYINRIYTSSKSTPLKYYIILKEDTSENREVFFEFLDNYELLGIDSRIPIDFSFLPNEASEIMSENNLLLLD
ncbi:hypothetical protein [Mucilaginibacter dorajii]|uniref:Uncharacterized protein n=1 Tax=Mucilaginibacter dorajii TaxID=692994 RepID=A0ABP7P1J7_9SPHI|nr:hypothetical protein [Mucilaginibacter dorajii]MCS3735512.1 hypothetical protein [Mucilaginibacter dorajii]